MLPLYAKLGVRDGLAAERTLLAAERTFLAYFRTALAMLVAGISGVRLLTEPVLIVVSYTLATCGLLVLILGLFRFVRTRQVTRQMLLRLLEESHQEIGDAGG